MNRIYQKLSFNDRVLHYRVEGEGDCLVFLHGFLESLHIWNDFVEILREKYRVICIDLPGHGKSDNLAETHSMQLMAEAVNKVLEHLSVKNCIMIGHSMGGYVTLEFAHHFHEKLLAFCLFHSHAAADNEEAKKNRDRTIDIIKNDKKGFIINFIPDLFAPENIKTYSREIENLKLSALRTTEEGIVAALKGMKERYSRLGLLESINIPVLLICGKKDNRIPMEVIKEQIILPGHSETLILGEVGHMGYMEARDKTLNAITYFSHKIFSTEV